MCPRVSASRRSNTKAVALLVHSLPHTSACERDIAEQCRCKNVRCVERSFKLHVCIRRLIRLCVEVGETACPSNGVHVALFLASVSLAVTLLVEYGQVSCVRLDLIRLSTHPLSQATLRLLCRCFHSLLIVPSAHRSTIGMLFSRLVFVCHAVDQDCARLGRIFHAIMRRHARQPCRRAIPK